MPKYSVVIPTYSHCDDLLAPCISSILKYTNLEDKEFIIVSNGLTDNTKKYVESLPSQFKLIWIDEAIGYTKATNIGIKASSGEFVILLNNDVILLEQEKDSWIKLLTQPFLDDPKTGISGPLKLFDRYANSEVMIFFCAMMKKSLLDEFSLLDESYSPGGGEDCNLSIQVLKSGRTLAQVPSNNKLDFTTTNTGAFPIYHAGEGTFSEKEIPEYGKTIIKKNGLKNLLKWNQHIKLNLGSGGVDYENFISVDKNDPRAHLMLDAEKILDVFKEDSVEEILASHLFEHINPYHASDTLISWRKALKPGGKLVMELPNFEELCKEFIGADKAKRYSLLNCVYGSVNTKDSGDSSEITSPHLWGWTPEMLHDHLSGAGFIDINFLPEQFPHPGKNMRVEATKPSGVISSVVPKEKHPLVSVVISTKDRYYDTLPLTLNSILTQSFNDFEIILFDDNEKPEDLRNIEVYKNIFSRFDQRGIPWKVIYGDKKGQVWNHQKSLEIASGDWIWRIDDDESPECNVLQVLVENISDDVGAISCSIIDPSVGVKSSPTGICNKMSGIFTEPNCQWFEIKEKMEVEHLYSSFLYRRNIPGIGYNLNLSIVGHREETMFSNMIYRSGYKLILMPGIKIWHYRNPKGGIRSFSDQKLWEHDEGVFAEYLKTIDIDIKKTLSVCLDCGVGDHICFREVWLKYRDKIDCRLFVTYPEVLEEDGVELHSIGDAIKIFGNVERFSIYRYLDEEFKRGNKLSLSAGFEKFYFGDKI